MAAKRALLNQNIESWFSKNVYNPQGVFLRNTDARHTVSTCCYYTTHFILKYATRPTHIPLLINHFNYFKSKDDWDDIWYSFKTNVCSKNNGSSEHQMFHFRINNSKERRNGRSIHDFIIEKCGNEYVTYQSCADLFELKDWMNPIKNNSFENSVPIYNKNEYGSSSVLSQKQISHFIDDFELHCDSFPIKTQIEQFCLAVYDLMDPNECKGDDTTTTMSVEQFDEQKRYKVKTCSIG